ncbi:S-adenosylmethionine:tRNA ribosyltransferase-isomerase [Bacillus sp. ISL-35]|uniref:S-adenosylmethionine:tRNA ribosyltransferase-isomerase n=1 Tax=Bacillus sp. ISL-35 TaxID=2819122 RepID=UPI001BE94633|nr:S-adenosylmethionine:tRNA ribosyltransferase-isomerase [Bacillus sp. ISL-35]MBT2680923.1 S-adenosylmethionine:tRNA ribosyltransferase-isomerase [Bacillus sp. ISL-35]MBT2705239.1 S-adenosylmethionine:tRNA ribosyltransferase-isomerase [Chryseobacterium sp. ISL-80]
MQIKTTADPYDFYLPDYLNASHPPERRGLRRDQVRMMVLNRETGHVSHDHFIHLENYLNPGDVLVLNNSRTIPAALKADWLRDGTVIGTGVELRLARKRDGAVWEVLSTQPYVKVGDCFKISETLEAKVIGEVFNSPLRIMQFTLQGEAFYDAIYSVGYPVRYEYIEVPWQLDYYQTVFASQPGSIEMPSAGRAFTWEMLMKLQENGVKVVYLQLHTGLGYLLDDLNPHSPEDLYEEYSISHEAMDEILKAKAGGRKIIAGGTTVVRALETAASESTLNGWTNLYVTSGYQLQLIDGIITGFHEPKASHLDMLTAFVNEEALFEAYTAAIEKQYFWHEFGDINLII